MATEKELSEKEEQLLEFTGYNTVGFRPLLSQFAVLLTEDHRKVLGGLSPDLPKEKEMKEGKIWLGSELELEKAEKELSYEVVAISKHLATLDDAVRVGDRVAMANNSKINEIQVDGQFYGIMETRNVIAIFKPEVELKKA